MRCTPVAENDFIYLRRPSVATFKFGPTLIHLKTHFRGNVPLNEYAAVGHSCVDLKMEVYYHNRQNKSSFLKMANLPNVSLETILSPPTRPLYGRCTWDRFGVC